MPGTTPSRMQRVRGSPEWAAVAAGLLVVAGMVGFGCGGGLASFSDPTLISTSFTVAQAAGAPQLTVTFTDTSVAGGGFSINGWFWTFGDGSTSTLQNPTHNFPVPGTYSVELTLSVGCANPSPLVACGIHSSLMNLTVPLASPLIGGPEPHWTHLEYAAGDMSSARLEHLSVGGVFERDGVAYLRLDSSAPERDGLPRVRSLPADFMDLVQGASPGSRLQLFDPVADRHLLVTCAGRETITVPAGEFDCAKVTLRYDADGDGGAAGGDGWTIWFHGDSFIVKQVRTGNDGIEIVYELMYCSGCR